MAKKGRHDFAKVLRHRFSAFVSSRESRPAALAGLMQVVRDRGLTVFSFGGTPRGVLHHGRNYRPRDLDLVFGDDDFAVFESIFQEHIQRRNSYGGLRLNFWGMAIDAWTLGSTWAFRTGLCSEPSFENLPRTTFLNVDGLAVELSAKKGKARRVYEAGFSSAWKQWVLCINLRENPHPAVCVARTLSISRRFGFKLSYGLAAYVYEMLTTLPLENLIETQINHYGNVEFPADSLTSVRRSLEHYLSSSSLLPFALFQMELPFGDMCEANEEPLLEGNGSSEDVLSVLACSH